MQKTKLSDEQEILNSFYFGICSSDLLGMINSCIEIKHMKTPDWKIILKQVRDWSHLDLLTLTPVKLEAYYKETLVQIRDYESYFVIESVKDVRYFKDELQVLVDWKYFPPSDPLKQKNWFPINMVDDAVVCDFLIHEDNKQKFKQVLSTMPLIYQQKVKYYLDSDKTKRTLVKTLLPQDLENNNKDNSKETKENKIELQKLDKRIKRLETNELNKLQLIKQIQQSIDNIIENKIDLKGLSRIMEREQDCDIQILQRLDVSKFE
ncbi:Chromo-like_domain superfamily [Hexamita inflata]|uniref:Chromo-like domain superfamily n=1 Tax=Hexamita inflata TaxID=28002 RepID=A0AA86RDH7_9EUKA|nr:Chromo-like domain superfamily [Hexamita inflata]